MLQKKINGNGQKDYQREDHEDRSLKYRLWLRSVTTDGFFVDVDLIKWKWEKGKLRPVAITEITRCDRDRVGPNYLAAILDRWFRRDKQAEVTQELARLLKIPAFIICYQKEMRWLWIYNFQNGKWKYCLPKVWAQFLKKL